MKYGLIGAVCCAAFVFLFLPPSFFGMEFSIQDRLFPNSEFIRRNFEGSEKREANAAIYTFYLKIVFAAVIGGLLGFFLETKILNKSGSQS